MIAPKDEQHQLELAVLGHLLAAASRPYLAGDVAATAPPACFMHPETRLVAEAVAAKAAKGEDADIVGVAAELQLRGTLASVGGAAFIGALAHDFGGHIWSEASLLEAAQRLSAERRKREAQTELAGIIRDVQTPGAPASGIAEALHRAAVNLESGPEAGEVPLDAHLTEYATEMENRARQKPVPLPWKSLNTILRGGIKPGEMVVLAARPSVGKSAFALNAAWAVACSGKKALFNSLEMSRAALIDRLAANTGSIDVGAFREGTVKKALLDKAILAMRGRPLVIYDATAVTVADIRRRIRIAQCGGTPVGLVVVDYLQLLSPKERSTSREREVAEMSRSLKCLAGELCVPLLVLAQLNRRSEEARREPLLSDLRESGAIEQDADIVIFLHQARQAWHADEPVRVIVAKGRSSGVGKAHLVFHRKYQRFADSGEDEYETAARRETRHWMDDLE